MDKWTEQSKWTNGNLYVKDNSDVDFLAGKGLYPYKHMTDVSSLEKAELPSKKDLDSHVYEEDTANEDYRRAQQIRKRFSTKNLGTYHDLYLVTDVYLLTDVFENCMRCVLSIMD